MGIFDIFRKQPTIKPTDKQISYASKLGIQVTSKMTRSDVSEAISQIEKKNPKLERQREHIKDNQRIKKYGQEIINLESWWNKFADDTDFMLAIYRDQSNIIVDVLRVNNANINKSGKIKLSVCAPKLSKDKYIGQYLDWDRDFDLPLEKLLYHEPLGKDFLHEDVNIYARIVEKGLKVAKRLR